MEYIEDPVQLPPRCRDPNARRLIIEAVRCHQTGAQRAAIVSIWTAVVYDIFAKVRELGQMRDAAAAAYVEGLDHAVDKHDLRQAQRFESSVLQDARDKFSLLSHNEYQDLVRLYEDRHRCAHPSLNRPEEIYVPAPELVRLHLRNAVGHLLSQPPVQGRAALAELQREVDGDLFPKTVSAAADYIQGGIYRRMKPALLRSFCAAVVASCLAEATDIQFARRVRALLALRLSHDGVISEVLELKLAAAARKLPDNKFERLIKFVGAIPDSYRHLGHDVILRVGTYLEDSRISDLAGIIHYALAVPELAEVARSRVQEIERSHLEKLLKPPPRLESDVVDPAASAVLDRVIELYTHSVSWDNSNRMANRLIIPNIDRFAPSQLDRILRAFPTNMELYRSATRVSVLSVIQAAGDADPSLMALALASCEMTQEDLDSSD